MRTILYSTERITANSWETGLFIMFLLVFAVSAAWYVLKNGLQVGVCRLVWGCWGRRGVGAGRGFLNGLQVCRVFGAAGGGGGLCPWKRAANLFTIWDPGAAEGGRGRRVRAAVVGGVGLLAASNALDQRCGCVVRESSAQCDGRASLLLPLLLPFTHSCLIRVSLFFTG